MKPLRAVPVPQVTKTSRLSASNDGLECDDVSALYTEEALEGDSDSPAEKKGHVAGPPNPGERDR